MQVRTDDGAVVEAIMYVWADSKERLAGPWDFASFEAQHIPEYLLMCQEFLDEHAANRRWKP